MAAEVIASSTGGFLMSDRHVGELHCGSYKHKTWRVVRRYDKCIICVCVYKRGAYRVCEELNALASGKVGASDAEDMYVS